MQRDPTLKQLPFNVNAATTTRTDELHPGGGLGLGLQGAGYTVGIWEADEGPIWVPELQEWLPMTYVGRDHEQLAGRVTLLDPPQGFFSQHATHVAGTIGGSGNGANPAMAAPARGMAPQVDMLSLSSVDDFNEMAILAPSIQVSNHSYGLGTLGWSVWDVDDLNGEIGKELFHSNRRHRLLAG